MSLEVSDGRRHRRMESAPPFSRSPVTTYLDRIDPVHEIEFSDVSHSRWDEVSLIEPVLALSPRGTLIHGNRVSASPISLSSARLYNTLTIRTIAALTQFHQLSTLQIAAFTGSTVQRTEQALQSLFSGGIVLRSTNSRWTHAGKDERIGSGVGCLWQVNTKSARLLEWFDGLSDLEYLLMSGGVDLSKGTNSATGSVRIRHNLAVAEIVLRAMEMCPGVIGGWGEPHTSATLFTNSIEDIRANIADGVVIGRDGSIILLEVSGHANVDNTDAGERLSQKATAWAAVAARTELPLKIIFVNVSPKARMQRFYFHIHKGLSRIDRHIVRSSAQQKGRESVFVADALDWFPFTLGVTQGFLELEAYSTETRRFHPVLPAGTELNVNSDTVVNTLGALHVPPWVVLDGSAEFAAPATA